MQEAPMWRFLTAQVSNTQPCFDSRANKVFHPAPLDASWMLTWS